MQIMMFIYCVHVCVHMRVFVYACGCAGVHTCVCVRAICIASTGTSFVS